MKIDHTDPAIESAFDAELLALRVGISKRPQPALIASAADREYTIGILRAIERNPDADAKVLRKVASMMTDDPVTGKTVLPAALPVAIHDDRDNPLGVVARAAILRRLDQRAAARVPDDDTVLI